MKLFITYESYEDGIHLAFEEFMKLPQKADDKEFRDTCPMHCFKILLQNLTYDQKKMYFD